MAARKSAKKSAKKSATRKVGVKKVRRIPPKRKSGAPGSAPPREVKFWKDEPDDR